MRALACVGGCVLLVLGAFLRAQQPATPQAQEPVFRGGIDLMALDVRVVDKDGAPVPGLTAADFVVTIDGQPRPVRALDYMTFRAARAPISAAAGTAPTNAASPATETATPGRVILFVVDDVSAKPLDIVLLTTAAQKMLPNFDPSDLVGLITTSGPGGFVAPTRDHLAVRAALSNRAIVGRADMRNVSPFVTVDEAIEITKAISDTVLQTVLDRECGASVGGRGVPSSLEICKAKVKASARLVDTLTTNQRDQQLQGYAHAISALRAEPSPRVLIALTRGFPLSPYIPSPLEAISRAAASADVTFYALVASADTGVDLSDRGPAAQQRERARAEESRFLVDGTHSLASAAGGEAFGVVGQADRFLRRIDLETSALYRLGIEIPRGDPAQLATLKVAVNRPGLSVRTNVRALRRSPDAPATSSSTAPPDPMRERLEQGGTTQGVPMHLATALRKDPASAHAQMLVTVDVPAATPGPLKTLFAVLDATGAIVQSGRADVAATPNDDYHMTFPVPLDEGDYRVRLVASDANGTLGSVDQPASAHLHRFGSVIASDLLVSTSGTGGAPPHLLAFDTLPAGATTIQAALELYTTDAATPALSVRISITPQAGGAPIADVVLAPTPRNGALIVSSSMPVDALGEGTYVFTAAITSAGQDIGHVTATVKKGRS